MHAPRANTFDPFGRKEAHNGEGGVSRFRRDEPPDRRTPQEQAPARRHRLQPHRRRPMIASLSYLHSRACCRFAAIAGCLLAIAGFKFLLIGRFGSPTPYM